MTLRLARLTAWALVAMVRYELTNKIFGFPRVRRSVIRRGTGARQADPHCIASVCDAVNLAACFYFKPVQCLQKSVVTVRLLRSCGVACRVVIGCRSSPFFSHAWVEVDGRVVNDSSAYREHLQVLSTM